MADSVALLRRKVQDQDLAIQDSTMNSVITLAAIEVRIRMNSAAPRPNLFPLLSQCQQFGKGNIEVSQMHIQGIRRMVHTRGGIKEVRRTSPLTARMVSW
jgi:hypothetical protein